MTTGQEKTEKRVEDWTQSRSKQYQNACCCDEDEQETRSNISVGCLLLKCQDSRENVSFAETDAYN